ncbi:unannotated protein [freshwater metagenome]|uniref:Unannotated protein n=1 Tax=freshwater metagenome TaxID=449393 RepID=A0A6J6GA52_9ZZZZ|nr:hypothetical protein [Actinomycetota bacterium]
MTAPHDRPTASELLEALREWMEGELLPSLEGRLQFHTRVAINSLDIVRREIDLGAEQQLTHAEVLSTLGFGSDEELAIAIRNGDFDSNLISLLTTLRPIVEDKVRVSNPKYLRS